MNGRFRGDSLARPTFHGKSGVGVVDYAVCSLCSRRRKGKGIGRKEKKEGDWGERVRDAFFPSLSLLSRFSPSPSPPPLFAPATQAMQYATKTNIPLYREFIVKRAVEFNRSQSNNDMA